MKREELKKQIEEVVSQVKDNSKDVHFADSLIDKLLSLKGQYDVEPTRVIVKESDVLKEYDNDSIRFIRCKNCVVFQAKGGMTVVVTPRMRSLYEYITELLNLKDNYDDLDQDRKDVYDALFTGLVWIMNAPIFATCDDALFAGIAKDIIKRFDEYTKSQLDKPLEDETSEQDASFENDMEMFNEINTENA